MAQRLFNVGKIPVFLDKCEKGIEKRKDGDAKIQRLTLRIQPFDAKLAAALDEGTEIGNVRSTVFKLNSGEPRENFTRHEFSLAIPRQLLECFASTDTPTSRVGLDGVKIHGAYVRIQADMNNLALVIKASFGPASRDELEFLEYWFRAQQAVTFKEGDPSLQWPEADTADEDDADGDADQPKLPAHEFDTDVEGKPISETKEPVRQRLTSHANKKRPALPSVRAKKKKAGSRTRVH